MEPGAILTAREAKIIVQRLGNITRLTEDRRIKEQARMICCEVNKATRRIKKSDNKKTTKK